MINLDLVNSFPKVAKEIKNLPAREISEKYGQVTEFKILSWAFNCLLVYTLHQQNYTFKEIQNLILENTQAPFYISIPTLFREAWIYENILSRAPELLRDPYLTKSHYKRMSQHQVPDPIKELNYIASRKEEESIKHRKYSISMWEQERHFGKAKGQYVCSICKNKVKTYYKVCKECMEKFNKKT